MSKPSSSDPVVERDALLKTLEGQHDALEEAARAGHAERLAMLLDDRQGVIDALIRVAKHAPIPPDRSAAIAEREASLQDLVGDSLAHARAGMAAKHERSAAALKYWRSR